ncbi:PREDICTED: UPF0481 protein At3g47200-like isoform X3 [Populus euphratica]|uniref:UPF0481 protein At3g47200-like isoform X2 n=1 Tax=Populus euphratica TaxID=75702 RepID=A0AAJ6TSB5_POPEU|nr:PREDICTED: UPF0481 protein At3g47200-like isoform X2 [Populus euphratica]XP_011016141.1 PREDICTED: UPF0481 protein At3g47200-like isoform X3 [Populus euphratica]
MGEIRSPYFSSAGDYLGVNAEIRSPYFSFDTQDYHGDNAGIHSSYFSAADYHGEDAEIPSGTFFHQDNIVENPYNAETFVEQYIVQNTHNAEMPLQRSRVEELYLDLEAGAVRKIRNYCIYRVPDSLRKSNEAIYTPQEVSIGPIHHCKKNLQLMTTQKERYLKEFCNRVVGETRVQQVKFLEKIWNTIKKDEENIRQCYEDGAPEVAENDQFVKMVLLDAVFILEYLLRNKDFKKYGDDSLLRRNGLMFRIRRDLLLLENQLPFFILEKLYNHLFEDGEGNYTSFRDLAYEYLNRYNASAYKLQSDKNILHFTDLVRSSLTVTHPDPRSDEPIGKFYSATKLHEAGINFKEFRNECLLDVKFSSTKGELRIPRLRIDHRTELLFGNLIALERCHYKGEEYICHYVKLLDTLVAKPKDVDLLIKNKIIETDRDGASVKNLIDKLSAETPEEYSIYCNLYKQLDQHYEKSWLKNSAYIRKVYFGNLWRGTATVSAAVWFLFSFVRTICAVLALR